MTQSDAKFILSRRRILAGMGAIGLTSAGAGLGTSALFSDRETFEGNQLVAGELDLKVDWQATYVGPNGFEYTGAFPDAFQNDPAAPDQLLMQTTPFGTAPVQGSDDIQDPVLTREEIATNLGEPVDSATVEAQYRSQFANVPDDLERPIIELDDVKPGDSGEVTFSLHLFDNPGYIWLTGELLENRENTVEEPEAADPDEDDSGSVQEIDDSGELAEEIAVVLWYDEDGDNVLDSDETIIVEGSLLDVMELLDAGVGLPLDGDRSTPYQEVEIIGDGSGSLEGPTEMAGNPSCADLGLLPAIKIESVAAGVYETPVGSIELVVTGTKDGNEVTSVDWSSDFPIHAVIAKGGAGANVYQELDDPALGSLSGSAESPNGTGISHLSFCYDAVPATGDGGRDCFVNSTTQYIGFQWSLPKDHANEIQTDSVVFDLGFYTEQCRHNDGSSQSPSVGDGSGQV